MFSPPEVEFLTSERVARMATINAADKFPHLVPVCFAFDEKTIVTTLHVGSKRIRNVERGSRVSILVDRYDEKGGKWKILRGLLIYGDTKILTYQKNRDEFMRGWKLLIAKYPQYKQWAYADLTPKDPDKRRMMNIQPTKVVCWGF